MAERGYKILGKSISAGGRPWLGLVAVGQKLERQPEQARNILALDARRDRRDQARKAAVVLISKKLQSECGNANESTTTSWSDREPLVLSASKFKNISTLFRPREISNA